MKVVHKGAADGENTFNTVVDALKSANGSAGRVAILVMPGYYEEDLSGYIRLNETRNVDIIGQGRGTTTIKAIGNIDSWRHNQYMDVPSGLTLRNLTFEGYLKINDTSHDIRITDCLIKSGVAISLYGNFSNITIENNTIESTEIGLLFFIASGNSTLSLKNLEIKAPTGEAAHIRNGDGNPVRFFNTNITAHTGIEAHGYVEINNSVINANVPLYGGVITGIPLIAVKNSEITGVSMSTSVGRITIDNSVVSALPSIGNSSIANSKVLSLVTQNGKGAKIVNCVDANYDVIPNGLY